VLTHLYVLLPVLDNDKHYYIGENEAEKLLHRGGDWLPQHPERGFITRRYLRYLAGIVNPTLVRLMEGDEVEEAPLEAATAEETEKAIMPATDPVVAVESVEPKLSLHDQRLQQVANEIYQLGPKRMLDLGCGEGKLLHLLLRQHKIEFILGMDVSHQALSRAAQRLHLDEMPPRQRARIELIQESLLYKDDRLAGFDAAALVEVLSTSTKTG